MKLQAEINDQKHEVEIKREDRRVFAEVDGRQYELEASEPEPGIFLFKHEGRVYEASVTQAKKGAPTHVRVGADEFEIRIIDPKRLRGSGKDTEHADGLAEITTAMPGKVVRLLVAAGDEVEKGAGIMVVEAMKMQNELKAPKAGTVKDVRVAEGDTVAASDILATIE